MEFNTNSKRKHNENIDLITKSTWSSAFDDHRDKNDDAKQELIKDILLSTSLMKRLDISEDNEKKLINFINEIYKCYNPNDYHSFTHACHVFLNCKCLWDHLTPTSQEAYSSNDIYEFALLFSAFIHDVDHLGIPNTKLIDQNHKYAKDYNNQSIAEMRSIYLAFDFIESNDNKNNFLIDLDKKEYQLFKSIVIELVLSTDAADKDRVKITKLKFSENSDNNGKGKMITTTTSGLHAGLILLLKCADVGAAMQSFNTGVYWAERFYKEIAWGSESGQHPLEDEKYLIDQKGYLHGPCIALARSLGTAQLVENTVSEQAITNLTKISEYLGTPESMVMVAGWREKSN